MNNGPIPPHERQWRHPSEVAAAQRAELIAAPPGRDAQRLALGAGACVVVLVMVTLFATISTQKSLPTAQVQGSVPPLVAQLPVSSVGSLPGEPVSISRSAVAYSSAEGADPCLATPIGTGQLALVTADCLTSASALAGGPSSETAGEIESSPSDVALVSHQTKLLVTLPDQSEQAASVVKIETADTLHGLSIVRLTTPAEPIVVAQSGLSSADSLALIGSRHMTYSLPELIEIRLPDGTPILNENGELVAISSDGPADFGALVSIDRDVVNSVVSEAVDGPTKTGVSSATVTTSTVPRYGAVAYGTTPGD